MSLVSEARFSTVDLMRLAGVSRRQADYWRELGVLEPTVPPTGSGSVIEWDESEVRVARVVLALVQLGVPLSVCGVVARQLRVAPSDAPAWRALMFVDADGFLHDQPLGSGWLVDLGELFPLASV